MTWNFSTVLKARETELKMILQYYDVMLYEEVRITPNGVFLYKMTSKTIDFYVLQDVFFLYDGQWLNDTCIEFYME